MANVIGWLLLAAWPIAKKVLVMMGIGWITYEGLGLIATQAQGHIVTLWGQLPQSVIQLASLGGFPQALGIILGAITARVSFIALGKLGKVAA